MKTYECHNPHCGLNVPGLPGRFTGGITWNYRNVLTGEPIPLDVDPSGALEGFCPTCGVEGELSEDEHLPHDFEGDPFSNLHQQVQLMVDDPENPTDKNNSQAVFQALVKENHG